LPSEFTDTRYVRYGRGCDTNPNRQHQEEGRTQGTSSLDFLGTISQLALGILETQISRGSLDFLGTISLLAFPMEFN